MSGAAIATTGAPQDPDSEFGHDQVKVFSHEGDDGENTDLHDVKSELEKDAEKAEVSHCHLGARDPRGIVNVLGKWYWRRKTKLCLRRDMGGLRFERQTSFTYLRYRYLCMSAHYACLGSCLVDIIVFPPRPLSPRSSPDKSD